MKQFFVLTLFPEMIEQTLSHSIMGRAQKEGHISVEAVNIRDFTLNKHKHVDDYPYGGGRGAVMTADPLYRCWEAVCDEAGGPVHTIYMSPCGHTFKQADAIRLSQMENLILVCGHYEGIDQRFIDECVDEEISLGDFVLTGGELAAMALTDAVAQVTGVERLDAAEPVLATERQRDCAARCLACLNEASDALAGGMTLDAVAVSLDGAIAAILDLTGERTTEAVVDEVFARFCVGK